MTHPPGLPGYHMILKRDSLEACTHLWRARGEPGRGLPQRGRAAGSPLQPLQPLQHLTYRHDGGMLFGKQDFEEDLFIAPGETIRVDNTDLGK